ncbi:DNA-binding transcriptional regulator [Saccharomonospora sp. CUA-673]|uniref:helix-turn-helix transcriptional regulator n=1 Tax=Saccharomonospora sp. CUA-673 TaxID=1904969 RepID=UPI000969770B|nr:WYL domain-containing protein [Saccharomonospora sp. CUA-673]OLT40116.1 DNA-binding transcriptional regulator [Saccharomonospora sp. CUA-673]
MRQEMPGRLLRLLSLLQDRREWPGPELAERLGVTTRTLRRDVDRLRALDYPVRSTGGTGGGYRLGPGSRLPPLLLDDEESVAVGVALATAAGRLPVAGLADSATRALAKLGQVLPTRLRPRLAAFGAVEAAVSRRVPADDLGAEHVDPERLAVLAVACRDAEVVTFGYAGRDGVTDRRVEPHHLVTAEGRWYLLAHDLGRDDWRTFRVDRMSAPAGTGRRFTPRTLPDEPSAYLRASFAGARYRHTATVHIELPVDDVRRRLPAHVPGELVADGAERCHARVSAESVDIVVQYVALVAAVGAGVGGDTGVRIEADGEVAERLRALGHLLGGST